MRQAKIGIIGGSGLYEIDDLQNQHWEDIESAFGKPSDQLLFGELNGQEMVFLPRHGRNHQFSPSSINYRANIDALKRAGVTDIISLSAVGSLKEKYNPGHFVLIDQFVDQTFDRNKTFFGAGCVAHVSFSHPISTKCSR